MEVDPTVRETQERANRIAAEDRAIQQRRQAKGHEKLRQEWAEHYLRLAHRHHDLAAANAAKADALMNGDDAA